MIFIQTPEDVGFAVSAVKTFLLENEVELPELFWRRLDGRGEGTRALTIDRVPTNLDLRKILEHMPIQGRALFLILSSSVMRIGETLGKTRPACRTRRAAPLHTWRRPPSTVLLPPNQSLDNVPRYHGSQPRPEELAQDMRVECQPPSATSFSRSSTFLSAFLHIRCAVLA